MTKEEISLQITLKLLDNFTYNINEFGGSSMQEHAELSIRLASKIFNEIYNSIEIKN